jgi:ADP-heptose:LPS heptosyltransferase
MKISTTQKIDRLFGSAICSILLVLRCFVEFARPRKEDGQYKVTNILFIKYLGMGSILCASPAFRRIKEIFPLSKVTILTEISNKELCENLPGVDSIITIDIKRLSSFLSTFLAALNSARKNEYDYVIDLEFFANISAIFTLLLTIVSRPKSCVGFNFPKKIRNRIYDIRVVFDHDRHIGEVYLKVLSSLGKAKDAQYTYEQEVIKLLEYSDKEYLNNLIKKTIPSQERRSVITININSGELCLQRRWPKEYFIEVVRALLNETKSLILLIGGRGDVKYVANFISQLPSSKRIINIAGKTKLNELVDVISKSDLFITNDSGPLHIGHILAVPIIAFFGPETPTIYGPLGNNQYVFYEDMYCSPCLSVYNSKISECKNNICMLSITPDKVLKFIRERFAL